MRFFVAALILTACTGKPALAPSVATSERDGISLAADPSAWSAKPSDLNAFAVALAVTVSNGSTHAIAVRSDDFVLFQGAREHLHGRELVHVQHTLARLSPRTADEPLEIASQPPPPLVGEDAAFLSQAAMTEHTSEMVEREDWMQSDRFLVYRGPRIYFAGPITYYGTPDGFYLIAQPAPKSDLAALALVDGVLKAGESRRGFLYFAHPQDDARHFTLSWTPQPIEDNTMEQGPTEPLTLTFARG